MKKIRKGFTLVELLVVIAILGALSAAMMISSNSAIASAKAASIVSNLQAIKTAAIVFYTDYRDVSKDAEFTKDSFYAVSDDYLDEPTIKMINEDKRYTLETTTGTPKQWCAGYGFDPAETDYEQVLKKLAARADRFGLTGGVFAISTKKFTAPSASNSTAISPTKQGNVAATTAVWMRVR